MNPQYTNVEVDSLIPYYGPAREVSTSYIVECEFFAKDTRIILSVILMLI